MMKTSDSQNMELLMAFPDAKIDLWNQNFVNDKYVIGYELDPSLHKILQNMLPKVRSLFRLSKIKKVNNLHISYHISTI